jgi:hypothetical protein
MTLSSYDENRNRQKAASEARLAKMMKQIQQEGNLDQVANILEKIERRLTNTYVNNPLYWILLPLPFFMVNRLQKMLNSNPVSQLLVDTLDWDDIALPLTNLIYLASWGVSFLSLIVLLTGNIKWFIVLCLACSFLWWLRYNQFQYAINTIGFLSLYNQIDRALRKQREAQTAFIDKIASAYTNLQNSKLNAETQRLIKEAQLENDREYRKKEIESQLALQGIAASLAIAQAEDNAQVEKIKKGSELDLLAYELRIRDQGPEKERWHQLALAEIHKAEAIEVAKAKILGEESEKNRELLREIQRNLAILSGLKTSIARNGSDAKADPKFNQGVDELVDTKFKFDSTQP